MLPHVPELVMILIDSTFLEQITPVQANNNESELALKEHHIFGSSRLGLEAKNLIVYTSSNTSTTIDPVPTNFLSLIGDKRFELSNHLGNVLAVVSDKKIPTATAGVFNPDVLSYSDYYPFGSLVPNRHADSNTYRYGFQGQEMDNELKGEGNSLNYTFRMHDPRVGRFFAVDPLFKEYPQLTPYQFASNSPIDMVEIEGMEGGWFVEKGVAVYKSSCVFINGFDSEEAAIRAAQMGFKTPDQLNAADRSYQQFLSRLPKVQKDHGQIRSNNARDIINSDINLYPGGSSSVGGGIGEGMMIYSDEALIEYAGKGFQAYKAYKASKITEKAIAGGLIVITEGKKGKGLEMLTKFLNPTGSQANCVLVSGEFMKKLLGRAYTVAGTTGGTGLEMGKIFEYLHTNFNTVKTIFPKMKGTQGLISILKEAGAKNSFVMGKLIKPMGGITDHFFVAIKNTDGSYKFIDVQNEVQYTKEAMDKTFSSYKAFEVK